MDLSGYWNDTDSRLTAEALIAEALEKPWIEDFRDERGRRPVVMFDGIENRTAEYIEQDWFLNSIQRELLDSRRVGFVARPADRERLRLERRDQAYHVALETRNPLDQELGADFLLSGSILYTEDADSGTQLRVYQVDLLLLSLRDNELVWAGQHRIRKAVSRDRFRR